MELITSITIWNSYYIDSSLYSTPKIIDVIDRREKNIGNLEKVTKLNIRTYTTTLSQPTTTITITDTTQPITTHSINKIKIKISKPLSWIDVKEPYKLKVSGRLSYFIRTKPLTTLLTPTTSINVHSLQDKVNLHHTTPNLINSKIVKESPIMGGVVSINVNNVGLESTIGRKYATIFIANRIPDYFSQLNDCIQIKGGNIPEFEIPVKIGEWQKILSLPPTIPDKIVKIYNKPFGIQFTEKEIFGRVIINQPYTMVVILNTNKSFKLKLVPYMSEFVSWLLNQ